VVANVTAGVGNTVESDTAGAGPALHVRMLGPLTVSRDGRPLALPASRKVRALMAYLVLAPHAVTRSKLCELLWDVPNDPRGELRWCLSKVRSILDEPGRRRVQTRDDTVALDLAGCFVDVVEIAGTTQKGIQKLPLERLRALCALFTGDFLDGLDIDRNPQFNGWLIAERRRVRGCHAALLEHLAKVVVGDEVFGYLETWLQLAPFDQRVHEMLLEALGRNGRIREGEEHLAATERLFEADGLDSTPLRQAWRTARAQPSRSPAVRAEPLAAAPAPQSPSGPAEIIAGTRSRASVAVMPFVDRGVAGGAHSASGDGLAYDVITRLAKLRSLFVIAQGTVFALHDCSVSPQEAGRTLNVDYVVSGSLRRQDQRLSVSVELAETRSARIVWAEVFDRKLDDAFLVLDEIGNRIVASIASEIETAERNRAILKPPNSLDAWEAHHRGLWHMYRFNRADNDRARHFFEMAVRLDPTFARAHAGLSFTHFQNAFQGWAEREKEMQRAYEAAGQSLMVDDRDPGAHWAMGRALWLRGSQDQSILELERAVDLSPNFALGHYALAFVHAQDGDARAALGFADHSRQLSPFDPMLFAMLGARAMALARLNQFEDAANWALKAASRPNAHAHIRAIAACCLALADRCDEAQVLVAAIHKAIPHYRVDDFLTAFHFGSDGTALFRKGAKRIGMD
jgi:DNA-binding SARP family transcriptional activator